MICAIKLLVLVGSVIIYSRASNTTNKYLVNTYATATIKTQDIKDDLKPLDCKFAPGLIVGSRSRELECCNETFTYYYRNWALRSLSLTTFLQTLRLWNCPQYQEQCNSRVFAFTEYSKLVYDYFCNYTLLVDNCLPEVMTIAAIVQQRNYTATVSQRNSKSFSSNQVDASTLLFKHKNSSLNSSTLVEWKNALSKIKPAEMTLDELLQPCIQIAQYDQVEVFDGRYQEIISAIIPTCKLAWCGFSADAFRTHKISFWSCFSAR